MSDYESLVNKEAQYPENPPPYRANMTAPASQVPVMNQPPAPQNFNMTNNAIIGGIPAAGHQNVGPKRMNTFCQNCQSGIKTDTEVTIKCSTHCCCILMALTGILGPCCCLPYCIATPEKVVHNCPNCKAHIGTYYG